MVDEKGSYNPWKKIVRTDEGIYDLEKDVWLVNHKPKPKNPIPIPTPENSTSHSITPQVLVPTATPEPFPTPTITPKLIEIPKNQEIGYYRFLKVRGGLSIFVEFSGGTGTVGSIGGYEIVITDGKMYLLQFIGEPVGSIDAGASVSLGVAFSYNEGISNYVVSDYEIYITGSAGKIGGSIGFSHDSFSIAYSPGAKIGFGTSYIDKMLITDFGFTRDFFQ